jgi:hypothetical protein
MKRSIMRAFIYKSIDSHTRKTLNKDTILSVAEEVLTRIEEEGMLPPDPKIRSYYVFDEQVHEIIAEWEPED